MPSVVAKVCSSVVQYSCSDSCPHTTPSEMALSSVLEKVKPPMGSAESESCNNRNSVDRVSEYMVFCAMLMVVVG